jgi:hypothetical protein
MGSAKGLDRGTDRDLNMFDMHTDRCVADIDTRFGHNVLHFDRLIEQLESRN